MKMTKFFSGLVLFSVFTFTLNGAYFTKKTYNPSSSDKFKISRSKIELFLKCPYCFYLDCKHGISQPKGFPFTLNNAVDALLKKEFDIYRKEQKPHPIVVANGLSLVPFYHKDMDLWRDALHAGLQYAFPNTNLLITGAVDDIWIDLKTEELFVVDYKATAKNGAVSLDADWQNGYKRQVEIYQWLLRKQGFKVSDIAFFVYCNGILSAEKFDGCLKFDIKLIPYEGDDSWVEPTIDKVYQYLKAPIVPFSGQDCELCQYTKKILSFNSPKKQK